MKTVYLDSSVVLRWLVKDQNALHDFGNWQHAASSCLLEVECLRTLDRLRNDNRISAPVYADLLDPLNEFARSLELFHIDTRVLAPAKNQYVACVKTLDAIQRATARLINFFSHDQKMNLIAKSIGLKTLELK